MKTLKELLILFAVFLKIGLVTFGGGYAMISVLELELIEKRKWLSATEFSDMLAISESTPGPISINMATFIGFSRKKVVGALLATVGVVLPAFIITFLISLFFDAFIEITWVAYAFKGIQVCVAFLILCAGIRLFKKLAKTPLSVMLFICAMLTLIAIDLFALNFSTVFLILIGGIIGVFLYCIRVIINRKNKSKGRNGDEKL